MYSQIHSYFIFSLKNSSYIFCRIQKIHYICIRNQATRALSSAGSEHLVYTQRVGGSNPSAPTATKSQKATTKRQTCKYQTLAGFFFVLFKPKNDPKKSEKNRKELLNSYSFQFRSFWSNSFLFLVAIWHSIITS